MKPIPSKSAGRSQAGILLVECLVYMSVFVIILTGAMAAFYFCWDNSKALIYTSDDVSRVLQVGEGWRADVRAATGRITVETTPDGDRVVIPAGKKQIVYRVAAGSAFHHGYPGAADPGANLVDETRRARGGGCLALGCFAGGPAESGSSAIAIHL